VNQLCESCRGHIAPGKVCWACGRAGPEPWVAEQAEKAARAIVEDLKDRRGLKWEWARIDADVQEEIAAVWASLILYELSPPARAPAGGGR
jgi:hypothetical protein